MNANLDKILEINNGLQAAYIDSSRNSNLAYRSEFITNNYREGRKVLAAIEDELKNCDEFRISVAFITMTGVVPLLQVLRDLESRGIPGKIMTTDYLTFSEPKALDKLASLNNIELKIYQADTDEGGFHTKGYIFRKEEVYNIIIGSSNLTANAITRNKEWNVKLVSTSDGSIAKEIQTEFDSLWNNLFTLDYDVYIEQYRLKYNTAKEEQRIMREVAKKQKEIAMRESVVNLEQYKLEPNKMQVAFIRNLNKMCEEGVQKALLLSSTGTGKTYASAFALREINPKRMLFIVHREQIAKQAFKSYKMIFGTSKSYGLISGSGKDMDQEFVFSTMQMISKDDIHRHYSPEEFDVIVVDEVHHAGASSYRKIMNYFKPKLWLGMTGSPDTNQYDIYSIFDHNIAYEIRLQQAMEEDLLCPFHYFGITDLIIDDKTFDDKAGVEKFNLLVSDTRVDYVIKQAQYYGFSGDRVKGLIFCSRKDEARELSNKFNNKGFRTAVLTGENSQMDRENTIEKLVNDDSSKEQLDYIFTVDIFNEGVDIPEVNQVIMLRPTQSPVVFIQQLGRGLRKFDGKEFVVIIDFIGNYMNNFMIPIALSGDRSYNKDNIRKYVREGNKIIPGSSSLHFDEVTKKKIYESIDSANFEDSRFIKDCYLRLRNKLGRIPSLKEFDDYGELDVLRIFDSKSYGSYYKFLLKNEKDYKTRLSDTAAQYIEFISKKLASGKRVHELKLIQILLEGCDAPMERLQESLHEVYNINLDVREKNNIINYMTNEFTTGSAKNTYRECIFLEQDDNEIRIAGSFADAIKNYDFRNMIEELIEFGIRRYENNYADRYDNTNFHLYSKYTYEDVCRLLNWEKGEVALNIGGYKFDKKTNTYPIFINYDKDENIQDTVKYEDRFVNPKILIAISKSGRTLSSDDVYTAIHAEELGVDMHLFVRKNKDDKISKEFYYLGKITATGRTEEFVMPNTSKNAVEIEYKLSTPVRNDLYEYITSD